MIVKNIESIQYFIDKFGILDKPEEYTVNYHSSIPRKNFKTVPTFVAEFEQCLTSTLPFIVTKDHLMITNHVWPILWKVKHKPKKTHQYWQEWNEKLVLNIKKPDQYFKETNRYVWLPIDEESANNPWHIWIDVISKFRLLELEFKKSFANYIFILSNPSKYFQKIVNELIPDLKFHVMPKNEIWSFEHLIVPSMSNSQDGIIVSALPKWLQDKFSLKTDSPYRKIFVSRKKSLSRRLTNTEEVFMNLKGWEKVELESLPIKEQMKLFAEAKEIITTHGAGLVNLLWCKPQTKVIEITLKEQLTKKVYPLLSKHLKLDHKVIVGKTIPIGNNIKKIKPKGIKRLNDMSDIQVDLNTLLQSIEKE